MLQDQSEPINQKAPPNQTNQSGPIRTNRPLAQWNIKRDSVLYFIPRVYPELTKEGWHFKEGRPAQDLSPLPLKQYWPLPPRRFSGRALKIDSSFIGSQEKRKTHSCALPISLLPVTSWLTIFRSSMFPSITVSTISFRSCCYIWVLINGSCGLLLH